MTRNYYFLLSGFFISTIGDWFYQLALPLLVYNLTHSAMSMAITYGLTYLPFLVILPFGGVIADRVDRRHLLINGDVASALIVGILGLVVLLYAQSSWIIWVLYLFALVLASVTPLYHPSFQSYVPDIVADQFLPDANSWLQSAENVVTVLGPLVGGVVITLIGSTMALFIDMFSFFGSAFLILLIRVHRQEREILAAPRAVLAPLREGFRYVWNVPLLRYGSLLFLMTNFATTLIQADFIFFLANTLHFNPFEIGVTFAFTGGGALGGALLAPQLLKRFEPGLLLLTTTICAGCVTFLLLAAHNVFTVGIPWGLAMTLSTINIVTWFTLRQRTVPSHLLGRVIATTRFIAYLSIPLAAFIAGALLTSTQNMYFIIGIAALLRALAGILGFCTPLRKRPGVVSEVSTL